MLIPTFNELVNAVKLGCPIIFGNFLSNDIRNTLSKMVLELFEFLIHQINQSFQNSLANKMTMEIV